MLTEGKREPYALAYPTAFRPRPKGVSTYVCPGSVSSLNHAASD